ncbi:phosphatidate cytidylyltransferase [candidate division KSB1 bacterium]|nr:phosphatidate cytidylyltransferase [candidate division KSB1 bacterium]
MQNNWLGLAVSYVYAFGLLFAIEQLGKYLKWPQDISRKIIHIAAGMWIWGILFFFKDWYWGIVPFASFIILNYYFYRSQTFKQMDTRDSSPGTIYFAISITLVFCLFWRTGGELDRVPIAVAGVMAMTWGDAFASLVGKKWGEKKYHVFGHNRTWVGSFAMALVSFVAVLITLWLLPASSLSPNSAIIPLDRVLILSFITTIAATLTEALSPAGTDNLTVPIISSLILYLLM